jgi:threonine/homoserine/homoserine lactone efflux protein
LGFVEFFDRDERKEGRVNSTLSVLSIAGAISIGAMSPGPSFVMVARTAVASSRSHGLSAALGMGVGGVLFAIAALTGLQVLLAAVPWFYFLLKAVGGAYLIYLGIRIWRGANSPLTLSVVAGASHSKGLLRAFYLGLGTQVSNPKAAIIYGSIFAALLPHDVSTPLAFTLVLVVFAIECGWYAIVAYVLSSSSPRAAYLRYKARIDRTAGSVLMLLGARLVATSR